MSKAAYHQKDYHTRVLNHGTPQKRIGQSQAKHVHGQTPQPQFGLISVRHKISGEMQTCINNSFLCNSDTMVQNGNKELE